MHLGEDVDLSYRLRDRGWEIRYVPRGVVRHEHRNRLGAFLRRRFEYGTSEATLQALHRRRRKRASLPPAPLALTLLGVFGAGPLPLGLAAAVLGLDALAARLRTVGSLAYYLGAHGLRYYGLAALALAPIWPALGVLAVAAGVGVGCVDYAVRRPDLALPAFLAFQVAENVAYGAGGFWGCLRTRSFATYRTKLRGRAVAAPGAERLRGELQNP